MILYDWYSNTKNVFCPPVRQESFIFKFFNSCLKNGCISSESDKQNFCFEGLSDINQRQHEVVNLCKDVVQAFAYVVNVVG